MTSAARPVVAADRLRPLFASRFSLAPDAVLDTEAGCVWVPRRGRTERWWARILHGGVSRVRLRLDARGLAVFAAIRALGRPSVAELGARLDVPLPERDAPGDTWPEEAVSLLVFVAALAERGVLVTEPI